MVQVIAQEKNQIEIALDGVLSKEEFNQLIHQLESLYKTFGPLHVLLDATQLEKYDFKVILDEYDFYKNNKDQLRRVAIVSDRKFETFIAGIFQNFIDVEFRTFAVKDIEQARHWIFPSPLP